MRLLVIQRVSQGLVMPNRYELGFILLPMILYGFPPEYATRGFGPFFLARFNFFLRDARLNFRLFFLGWLSGGLRFGPVAMEDEALFGVLFLSQNQGYMAALLLQGSGAALSGGVSTRAIDRTGGTVLHTSRTNPSSMSRRSLPTDLDTGRLPQLEIGEDRFDLMRPMSDADDPAECPECGSTESRRAISNFPAITPGASPFSTNP